LGERSKAVDALDWAAANGSIRLDDLARFDVVLVGAKSKRLLCDAS
jgi:hypothetical protein